MEKKNECRIVEDLLPNYLEVLTNKISNEFIETHLKECSACDIEKQKMTKKLEVKVVHNQEKEKDFMKVYRRKINVLKIIIGAIIILEIIFLGDLGRKFFVINKYKIQMEQKNGELLYQINK